MSNATETMTIEVGSVAQRLAVEAALAMIKKVEQAAREAPDGSALAQTETVAVDHGRAVMRRMLEETLQQRLRQAEKERRSADASSVTYLKRTRASASETC